MSRQLSTSRVQAELTGVDLICLSHLRWGFVFQRPQHLMSRFAKHRRVFYVEEPIFDGEQLEMRVSPCPLSGVNVAVPALPAATPEENIPDLVRALLASLIEKHKIREYVAWFYTPMALSFASHLRPTATIYDCMDELSLFRGAPPVLLEHEKALLDRADLVFTGGLSLFEAKCERHRHVHAFPSSVDVPHFAKARAISDEPSDQREIPHPRIGYAGVIDERMDLELIAEMARLRPDWHIVMIGPVVKIPEDSVPKAANIHYLGMKKYTDLPAYFAGWDVAILPFALNESTRFISPTKTPEYLAAGLPVVSTPIRDVVRPYGEIGLARIASTPAEFAQAVEQVMTHGMTLKWRERADAFLSTLSWDDTWRAMNNLVLNAIHSRRTPRRVDREVTSKKQVAEALNV